MKYKDLLDIKLVHYLLEQNHESYNKLKNAVKEKSDDVFSFHINRLLDKKIISKTPEKRIRGKKTFHYLTSFGKYQYGLKLILTNEKKQIYQEIYQQLFLYEFYKSSILLFNEKEFKDFLSRCNISCRLEWAKIGGSEEWDWWTIIYPKTSKFSRSLIKEFWSREENKDFILCDLNFMALIENSDHRIWIRKTEHWQINRIGSNLKYGTTFIIDLPGIDYTELINNVQITHKKLTKLEIDQARVTKERLEKDIRRLNLNLERVKLKIKHKKNEKIKLDDIKYALKFLKQKNLIEIIQIGHNKRIVLNDEKLRKFIEIIQYGVHSVEMDLLINKWYFFDKPTKKEIERMIKLLGKEQARDMFFRTEIVRKKERTLMLKSKNIYDYVESLKVFSGVHIKSKITDDPSMTEKEKELYKYMTILPHVDEYYTSNLDHDLHIYENLYIPREIRKKEEELKKEKLKRFDPSQEFKTSLKSIEEDLKKLRNYKNDPRSFFQYRRLLWSDSYMSFEINLKDFKNEFKDIFDKYEYVLNSVFEIFLPSLAKLEPEPYYT